MCNGRLLTRMYQHTCMHSPSSLKTVSTARNTKSSHAHTKPTRKFAGGKETARWSNGLQNYSHPLLGALGAGVVGGLCEVVCVNGVGCVFVIVCVVVWVRTVLGLFGLLRITKGLLF